MLKIGITGGIGCGKSAVTHILEQQGITIVDADIVAREVVAKGTAALKEIELHFGADILLPSGELNRAKLRQQIFSHPEDKQWLEALLHPIIRQEIVQQLSQATSKYAVLVSPLLLETDQYTLVDKVVVIDVTEATQLSRTMARDNNSETQVKAIMAAQHSREERLAKADWVIENEGSLTDLSESTLKVHQHLLTLV